MQGVDRLGLLKIDFPEPVDRFVTNILGNIAVDHGGDRTPCPLVHAVSQLEIPDGEFRQADMGVEGIQLRLVKPVMLGKFAVQPGDRVEPLFLESVIEGFAEVQVAQVLRSAGRARGGNSTCGDQPEADYEYDQAGHDYLSLKLMPWSARTISTSAGPISLLS